MKRLFLILSVVFIAGCIAYAVRCPCDRVPGVWLYGTNVSEPVADWSFVNDREQVPLCQLQVTSWKPHAINLNCMAADGQVFLSCSRCEGKSWSTTALANPNGRLRAAGLVYPVTIERVEDPAILDVAWQARLNKVNGKPAPRPDHWWSFKLVSR